MRVLVIKTSSLGDIVHTLPALSDAARSISGICFDWVVEEAFSDIPAWHPAVDRVIPVALRRWRRNLLKTWRKGEWGQFRHQLRQEKYDAVIDAQGLIKSAFITRMARGFRYGLDKKSAREPLASNAYDHPIAVAKGQHAIVRIRQLFAGALGYEIPETGPDYGIANRRSDETDGDERYLVFLHGTTWQSKRYPEVLWIQLARLVNNNGFKVYLPWGDDEELKVAESVAGSVDDALVLPKQSLQGIASILKRAAGVIAVDTGLAHLAAAFDVPTVALYGATQAELTGVMGLSGRSLAADYPCSPCLKRQCNKLKGPVSLPPCYDTLTPESVWRELRRLMEI